MPRVKTHTDEVAARLLEAALAVYSAEGAHSVTVRRVAAQAGTSASAVYTLYGNKDALLVALFRDGFRRLGERLAVIPSSQDPLADMLAIGLAYRDAALAAPRLYELLFSHPIRSLRLDEADLAAAEDAYEPLRSAVGRAVAAGLLTTDDVEHVTRHLWATAHGMISLELAGWAPPDPSAREAEYTQVLLMAGVAHVAADVPRRGPGRVGRQR